MRIRTHAACTGRNFFDFMIDFSSSSRISNPLLMFQEQILICLEFVFVFVMVGFNIGSVTGSTGAGFPIGTGSGSPLEGQPG